MDLFDTDNIEWTVARSDTNHINISYLINVLFANKKITGSRRRLELQRRRHVAFGIEEC